jgi:amidohydrolase
VSGTTYTVDPDSAHLKGTIRAFDGALRARLAGRVEEVARGIATAMRATAEVELFNGPPPVVNAAPMAELVRRVAREKAGEARVVDAQPTAGADDVAEYLERVPGCYFWVGTRNEARGIVGEHHHPKYDLDESALPLGVEIMVGVAERFLAG